ncbi:MAG: hypothetical protein WBN93_05245, partial [Acidimicrobiia bacterium]
LMLSNGVPMFRMGDEFLTTQGGNNNPYNQDNTTTWIDWDRMDEFAAVRRFFRLMIAFRGAHPSIGRSTFWRDDVTWFGTSGPPDLSVGSHSIAYALSGASEQDDDLYVMINAWTEPLEFTIQEGEPGEWRRVIDTSLASPDDIAEDLDGEVVDRRTCRVDSRSVVVLVRPVAESREGNRGGLFLLEDAPQ